MYKIPRKKKKYLKKMCDYRPGKYFWMNFNWHFYKRMVKFRNMCIAGMDVNITPERLQWIRNGLLLNGWQNRFESLK